MCRCLDDARADQYCDKSQVREHDAGAHRTAFCNISPAIHGRDSNIPYNVIANENDSY